MWTAVMTVFRKTQGRGLIKPGGAPGCRIEAHRKIEVKKECFVV